MKKLLSIFITCSINIICPAQADQEGQEQPRLFLYEKIPIEIRSYPSNRCEVYQLLNLLRDSLLKEGFTIIDSIRSKKLQNSFLSNDLMNINALKGKTPEEIKARSEGLMKSKKILQELSIENFSCLDTSHNYTIRIYLFPRPRTEEKTLSFTLPFNSPYRISDIILSLIERDSPKK